MLYPQTLICCEQVINLSGYGFKVARMGIILHILHTLKNFQCSFNYVPFFVLFLREFHQAVSQDFAIPLD